MIRIQRTNEYELKRRLPLQTKGESLLSGNIFCATCGGRLVLTTNGRKHIRSDGTEAVYKRVKYICYNKSRKIVDCDGQTGYIAHKVDEIISALLQELFKNINDTPDKCLVEKQHNSELVIVAGKLKAAKLEVKKISDNLNNLQNEVVKAIQGISKFDANLLNDLIKQTKERQAIAKAEVADCELEVDSKKQCMSDTQARLKNLVSWADMFVSSDKEVRKMIAAYLIEDVKVSRGYNVEVKFHVAYEQFFSSAS
jgi:small-conductance mechanosensitive channel